MRILIIFAGQPLLAPVNEKTGHARIFKTIGDYAAERFFSSLVDPTIKIYKDKNSKCLSIADIKIDNNNISHTYRLGLIEKSGKNYSLTPLGEYYLSGRIKPQDLFRKQMLRYSKFSWCRIPHQLI